LLSAKQHKIYENSHEHIAVGTTEAVTTLQDDY